MKVVKTTWIQHSCLFSLLPVHISSGPSLDGCVHSLHSLFDSTLLCVVVHTCTCLLANCLATKVFYRQIDVDQRGFGPTK